MTELLPRTMSHVCQRFVGIWNTVAVDDRDFRWRIKEFAAIVGVPEAT